MIRRPHLVDPEVIAGKLPPPREWFVDGMIPRRSNVLFSAHGGSGKTLLLLHLAVCVALGLPFFGRETQQCKVVVVLAEDDHDEIHRRLAAICAELGVTIMETAGWLYLFDAVGCDVALFSRAAFSDDGRPVYLAEPERSLAWQWAKEVVQTINAELVLLDSVSDMYDGDENRRPHVRRFLNACLDLVLPLRGSVVLTAHVDKAVARGNGAGGQTYSGSTAWHNSVRARLALHHVRADEEEGPNQNDDGRRRLVVEKLNYGKPGLELPIRYDQDRHVFVPDGDVVSGGIVGAIRDRNEQRGVLKAIVGAFEAGSPAPVAMQGPRTAYMVLSIRPEFPDSLKGSDRARRRRFGRHLEQLRQIQYVREVGMRRGNRHETVILEPTTEGRAECATFAKTDIGASDARRPASNAPHSHKGL